MNSILQQLIAYAILAPSAHNTQPWIFFIKKNTVEIKPNMQLRLKISDPSNRELYISLGTAAENLAQAAKAFGLQHKTTIAQNESKITSILFEILGNSISNDLDTKLLSALKTRHTNRNLFENKPLPEKFLNFLDDLNVPGIYVTHYESATLRNSLANLSGLAAAEAFQDKAFRIELSNWVKPNLKRFRSGMPGYTLGFPWLISFIMPFVIRTFDIGTIQKKMHIDWINHSACCLVISVAQENSTSLINVGRIFEQIAIEAEKINIRSAILTAPIEIGQWPYKLKELVGLPGRPVLFARLGYGKPMTKKAPRMGIEQFINQQPEIN